MAVAQLVGLYGLEETLKLLLPVIEQNSERDVRLVARLVERGLNTSLTSSAGRLFDAVAALAGVPGSRRTTYEGQAAIELELAADGPADGGYPFGLQAGESGWIVETQVTLAAVVEDLLAGRSAGVVSARFHRTMAEMVVAVCERLREENGTDAVALSGGTFQNLLLLDQVVQLLEEKGLTVYRHRRIPPNDGGLALGQAVLADRVFRKKEE